MMMDIRSIAGSSRPSHHGQGSERQATSHSRVRRSCQTNARDGTTAVVATAVAAHRQHSAAMAVMETLGAEPEATLEVARQLLHDPPGLHASLSVAEQWRHNVDQLIIIAINMPPHAGRQANHPDGAPVLSITHSS
jgi:hypothetical protein